MKINYSKIIGVSLGISLAILILYGGYYWDKKMEERSKAVSKLQNKTFPLTSISDLDGKSIDSSVYLQNKMIIFLSVKCPHCLKVVKAFDENNDNVLKAKILPVFKASASEIDSFSKKNDLKNLHLFHIEQSFITHLETPQQQIQTLSHKEMSVIQGGECDPIIVTALAAAVVASLWNWILFIAAVSAYGAYLDNCENSGGGSGTGGGDNPCPTGGYPSDYSLCQQLGGHITGTTSSGQACCEE